MSGRRLLMVLALGALVGCSSKDDESKPEPAPAATPTPPAPAPPAVDPNEARCRDGGDGAACAQAAAAAGDATRSGELYELACIHGDATGCSKTAASAAEPALRHGMACRRGDDAACASAPDGAAALLERVVVDPAARGPVADKLRGVYRHTIADCLAALPDDARGRGGSIDYSIKIAGGAPTELDLGTDLVDLSECLARSGEAWRFTGADQAARHEVRVTITGTSDEPVAAPTPPKPPAVAVAPKPAKPAPPPPAKPAPKPAAKKLSLAVTGAQASATTSLTAGAVRSAIAGKHKADLQACYKELLDREPDATRQVVPLELRITDLGRTGRAKANAGDGVFESCIGRKAMSWKWPVPKDGSGKATAINVTLDLRFSAK